MNDWRGGRGRAWLPCGKVKRGGGKRPGTEGGECERTRGGEQRGSGKRPDMWTGGE